MTLKYEHLIGLPFSLETQNCYQLLRAFYRDNYDIELTDYACPTNWWAGGMDLIMKLSSEEGFSAVHDHPRMWRAGDVIAMAVQSHVANHVAILLEDGRILHHLYGQLSCVTPYGGTFRNNTLAVFRHRLVPPPAKVVTEFKDLLPTHVQRRLADLPDRGS
jgi:cell wall-associated NlpC family hydrolase